MEWDKGYNQLHLAVLENNLFMVKYLLSRPNIDVNVRSHYHTDENTALHLAAKMGSLSIIKELLLKRANVSMRNRFGYTALCFAAKSGIVQIMEILVDEGANVNLMGALCSPLHFAVESGCLEAVDFLISEGSDLNAVNINNVTALHYAARNDDLALVELLVENGADIHAKDKDGCTAIHYAAGSGRDFPTVDFLFERGADINAANDQGLTPLCFAALSGNYATVEFLVENGADISVETEDGWKPVHYAVLSGELESVKELLIADMNALFDIVSAFRLLSNAVQSNSLAILRFLVSLGIDVNTKDLKGNTLLHILSRSGTQFIHFVKYLTRHGADFNAVNEHNMTPLHSAAYAGNSEVLNFLVYSGANIYIRDIFNKTPLQILPLRF